MLNRWPGALSLSLLLSCQTDSKLQVLCSLPQLISESSGIENTADPDLIWTIQDSGNPAAIYALDRSGNIVRTLSVSGVKNHDWEDLTADSDGNLYIGDFGNNANKRTNLAIYRIDAASLSSTDSRAHQTTHFFYPEQQAFPPKKSQMRFDAESFFHHREHFYIFTKNRSVPFDGETVLYEVPAKEGNFAARKLGSFKTGENFNRAAVTAADISPDGRTVALLCAASVWLFTDFDGTNFLNGKARKIELNHFSQKEALCFDGNNKLLLADERKKHSGGKIYELQLDALKSEP